MAFKQREKSGCMYVREITDIDKKSVSSNGTEGFSANGYQKNSTALTASPICTMHCQWDMICIFLSILIWIRIVVLM